MNTELVDPFLNSISNVLSTMAMLELNAGTATIKKTDYPEGDITGVIAMNSPQTNGTLAISFSKEVIFEIHEKMLGEKLEDINDDAKDLVGELINMAAGGAKTILHEKGYEFEMTTPTIFCGKKPKDYYVNNPVIVIPFNTPAGNFFVEVSFQSNNPEEPLSTQ